VKSDWRSWANCLGIDTNLFYPAQGGFEEAAKAVCAGCVVREECLEYALVNRERFGIWGGTSERGRKRMRRGAKAEAS
jgi:WhiB family redox-sensing transcriptional regulator